MAKVFPNSMAARAGFVEILNEAGQVRFKYQRLMPSLRRVDFPDNRQYVVQARETLQGIALKFLGTAELWWVIAEFNRILDPFTEVTSGKQIIIPSVDRARMTVVEDL